MSKSITDTIREMSKLSTEHGKNMYILALQYAVNMIEIDPVLGLEGIKKRLKELEKEREDEQS